jgi:hypothetical protein
VHDVIAEISRRMLTRGDRVPGEAIERLREITDGPSWAGEIEQADR